MGDLEPIQDSINTFKAKARADAADGGFSFRKGAAFSTISENHYKLDFPAVKISLEVSRLRRDHNELIGELAVSCGLPGAKVVYGGTALSIGDFNLSSIRARTDRAKLLAIRSGTQNMDWVGLIEELCQKVLEADRRGVPGVFLSDIPLPPKDDAIQVDGLRFPRRHPTVIFGDGGSAKSYLSLYLAGTLACSGMRVGLFDWELDGEDHRVRLGRLFGLNMPQILYMRCEHSLYRETDRLSRAAAEHRLEYAIYDSVAFACDGAPESAEVCGVYFRAVRQIGVGSLHIAHITKGENGDRNPFGSIFWNNGARATWFVKKAEQIGEADSLEIGLFNRKVNLDRPQKPVGFRISFGAGRTWFTRSEPAANTELSGSMSISQKIAFALRGGALSPEKLAEEVEEEVKYVNREVKRHPHNFIVLEGGRIGLLER